MCWCFFLPNLLWIHNVFQHMSDLFSHNLNYRKGAFSLFWLVTKTQSQIYIYIYIYSHLYIHVNTMRRIPSNLPFSVIFATMVKPPWGAGKSTLVQAFLSEAAAAEAESGPTVGADFKVRTLKHAGKDRPWAMEMRSGWSGSRTPVTVLFFCLRI